MQRLRRRFLAGIVLLLGAGCMIGWLYSAPVAGLLVAALAGLAWQVRQVLRFDRALSENRLNEIDFGGGIWGRLAARTEYLRERGRKHKRRHRRLLREIRQSTNAMPDGGIVLNRDGEIVLANQAARTLAGISMPQDRGQRIDNILREPSFVEYLEKRDTGRAVEIPSPVTDDAWLACHLLPFGGEQYLLLLRDVTESIRMRRMRRDFVANASHELRSPLTVIGGYLDALAEDPNAPGDWRQPLKEMRVQAARMNRVVAELLELSRLENRDARRVEHVLDMSALLAFARRAWHGQPDVPRIDSEITLSAGLRGVGAEIESVIANLLSNAVRHTPAKGHITLSWSLDDEGGGCLAVTDTGEGIAEEHVPRLTERFFRVDEGRGRESGGVGLGLAIVKHALKRHDATLAVHSTPGVGSRFECHFPASRLVPPEAVPIDAAQGTR